ncbi:unnamed protein product [Polarella glacialis]|uniref:Autophagy-related protein n=1 Tax=Polarella glacialis TaxID=89957 RepID=A0A813GNC9_POLGL|nr:unnamed protein product [Polarella glacialis]
MEGPDSDGKHEGQTTEREIFGWYMYDWANSPYFQVYLGPILLILLKWLAEGYAAQGLTEGQKEDSHHLTIPGIGITAGSYPAIVQLITTCVQVVCLLTFSAFGDFGGRRKQLLVALTMAGSALVCLNIFCYSSSMWWVAGLLRVSSGSCFSLATVYYNSYLPVLVASHKDLQGLEGEALEIETTMVTDKLSGHGMMIGYAGGLTMLIISGVILQVFECKDGQDCSEFNTFFWPCLCVFLVGVWWAAFSQITFRRLKTRVGPPFPKGNVMCLGWRQSAQTLCYMCSRRQTLLFMCSFFLYSDGINTICTAAPLIMEDELKLGMKASVINAGLGAVAALLGVFMFMRLQACLGWSGKAMIISQLFLYSFMSGLGGGGLITAWPTWGFYVIMAPSLIMMGAIQSYTRSLFASLIPKGMESAMFAFFAITDKGSNVIGPCVIALVHNWTGKYTGVFLYLMPAFLLAAIILCFLDAEPNSDEGLLCEGEDTVSETDKEDD